jgi:hypothetical protein
MNHILLLCPDEKDATSFYRGWGPFGDLARDPDTQIVLHRAERVAWSTIADKSLVVLQRPCTSSHFEVLKIARDCQVPVWCDWDDLLWEIPPGNQARLYYVDPTAVKNGILKCADMADRVTVSTAAFQHAFPERYHEKIQIIRNRLPVRWRICTAPQPPGERLKLLWRGSQTHAADWIDSADGILAFSKQHTVEWHLVGIAPQWLIERLTALCPVYQRGEIPMEAYFRWLIADGPRADMMVVPLRDNAFNRAKSNIAQLEATFGGMLTVGPKWPEWTTGIEQADRLLYASPQQIESRLARAAALARNGTGPVVDELQQHFLSVAEVYDTQFRRHVVGGGV